MNHLLSQINQEMVMDLLTKFGWPGVMLLIVMRGLERIEHTVRGLSMALWMELSTRRDADPFVRATAQREIAKMEAKRKP